MRYPPGVHEIRGHRAHLDALRQLRARLYTGLPGWHAPPLSLELQRLDESAPFWRRHPRASLVFARGREVLGRIVAFTEPAHPETGTFGGFDASREPGVAHALLAAAEGWLASRGCRRIQGPLTFSMHEEVGMLVEGFQHPPALMMPYNPPYYPELLAAAGYRPQRSFRTFRYDLVQSLSGFGSQPAPDPTIVIRPFARARRPQETATLLAVYNRAFAANWGFSPLTPAACDRMVDEFLMIGDPRLVRIAEIGGQPAGFILCLPDVNGFFHRTRAWPELFKLPALAAALALGRVRTCRVVTLAVDPRFRGRGLGRRLIGSLAVASAAAGYGDAELSYVDTHNEGMEHILHSYRFRQAKLYAVYGKRLAR